MSMQQNMPEHVLVFPLAFSQPGSDTTSGQIIAVCSCDQKQSSVAVDEGLGVSSRPSYAGMLTGSLA